MKRLWVYLLVVAVTALAAGQNDAHAQDPLEPKLEATADFVEEWGLSSTPYIFFASQSINVGSREIRQSFSDLSTLVDAGFQGRLTARYRRILFAADGTYANLGLESDIGPTSISKNIEQLILEMKLFLTGVRQPHARRRGRCRGLGRRRSAVLVQ